MQLCSLVFLVIGEKVVKWHSEICLDVEEVAFQNRSSLLMSLGNWSFLHSSFLHGAHETHEILIFFLALGISRSLDFSCPKTHGLIFFS